MSRCHHCGCNCSSDASSHVLAYPDDIARIQGVAFKMYGNPISEEIAAKIWEEYSEGYAAGWLTLEGVDDYIIEGAISDYGIV